MDTVITITEDKPLRIYMHPLRQRILRTLERKGRPMTAKQLSVALSITPAAAKHHLLQLASIGLVGVDHTEQIHGITATYYGALPVTVSLGLDREGSQNRRLMLEQAIGQVVRGAYGRLDRLRAENRKPNGEGVDGDLLTGVVHLTDAEAMALYQGIRAFLAGHRAAGQDTRPYEFALAFYRAEGEI